MEACELVVSVLLLKRQKLIPGTLLSDTTHRWSKIKMKINFIWVIWARLKLIWTTSRDLLKPFKLARMGNKQNYKILLKIISWIISSFKTTIQIIPKRDLKTVVTTNSFKLNRKFLTLTVNYKVTKALESVTNYLTDLILKQTVTTDWLTANPNK